MFDADPHPELKAWMERFLAQIAILLTLLGVSAFLVARTKAQNTNPSPRHLFPVGEYRLDAPVNGLAGLKEFSTEEYAVMGRHFEGEIDYNAPPVDFLGRQWQLRLTSTLTSNTPDSH